MAANERPYLDRPEELEFPTETWAAQDLRKGNVLLMAAALCRDESRRARMRERGRTILDSAWRSLMGSETRLHTRPIAIVLQQGYVESYFRGGDRRLGAAGDPALEDREFVGTEPFVGQKEQIRRSLRFAGGSGRAGRPDAATTTLAERAPSQLGGPAMEAGSRQLVLSMSEGPASARTRRGPICDTRDRQERGTHDR